jgi:hypothetical protein
MENTEMMNYGYVEGTEFEALMPAVMETCETTGASDEVVERHGFKALGSDALEVVDIEAFFEE